MTEKNASTARKTLKETAASKGQTKGARLGAAKMGAKKPPAKTTKKATKKTPAKTTKKAAKKPLVEKTAKKVAKKPLVEKTAKKPLVEKTAKKAGGKKGPSSRDVALKIALDPGNLSTILKSAGFTEARKLRKLMRDHFEGREDLLNKVREFAQKNNIELDARGRGRTPPALGEERAYKTQQTGKGGPFTRVPLDTLGVKGGDAIKMLFEKDQIIIRVAGQGPSQ